MAPEPVRINLWTAPRCCSTVFERPFFSLHGVKVYHEPYSVPYYFGPDKISSRYSEVPDGVQPDTFAHVLQKLQAPHPDKKFIFSKDMAYYLLGRLEEPQYFSGCTNTFLIRSPTKAIPSLYKASIDVETTGWSCFDPSEAGFEELYKLYWFCKNHLHQDPIILDADDLLDHPRGILQSYCAGVGIEFSPAMLEWEPGPIPDFNLWNGWHDSVISSNGFATRQKRLHKDAKLKPDVEVADEHPDVIECIARCMPFYNELHSLRMLPAS